MYSSVCSGALNGMSAYIADVEVDTTRGLPGFDMVGKLSGEVKEARERVRVALKNCDMDVPPLKITVNISPADISKSGTAFDLPIAVGIMVSTGRIPADRCKDMMLIGELGLMGDIRAVSGVLPMVIKARDSGIGSCMVPQDNAMEAAGKLPDPEQRLISLTVTVNGAFLLIEEENYYQGEIIFYEGLPMTSKEDKLYHGFGVQSIHMLTEKYEGDMQMTSGDGLFRLSILLPVPQQGKPA